MVDAGPPFVTIIIPVRNESGHIGEFLASILAQDYPADRIEVIVADGCSSDSTPQTVLA